MSVEAEAFVSTFDKLATDVGRLRRRVRDDVYGSHLVDRVAGHIETLDVILRESAGELCADGFAVDAAIAHVDRRARKLRSLLGDDWDTVADKVQAGQQIARPRAQQRLGAAA